MTTHLPLRVQAVLQDVQDILGSDSQLALVGGSVRDILLGQEPKDFDFATSLVPDEVEARVRAASKRVYAVGKRFGTIGFRHNGVFIEVTTFRKDLYDFVSRKPKVIFTHNLLEDLARRDFTINAIAISMKGDVVDPYDGAKDLQAGILRAVGKPRERFAEDALRILRLARFTARFGFSADPLTAQAATNDAFRLADISTERISAELDAVLTAPHAAEALQLLAATGALSFTVPPLALEASLDVPAKAEPSLWAESLVAVVNSEPTIETRWAALLQNSGLLFMPANSTASKTAQYRQVTVIMVDMIARYLHWSKERRLAVQRLLTQEQC